MHVHNFPSTHPRVPTKKKSYQGISHPPTEPVRCARFQKIFASIHKTAEPPPAATERFLFPLKGMNRKGDIVGGGNTGKRSVTKLARLSDGCRGRIGNKKK